MNYTVVEASDVATLETLVAAKILQGFKCQGGVSVSVVTLTPSLLQYTQAMVKDVERW